MKPDAIAYPPRGLSHDEAARYVGISPARFDQLVADGVMPRPKRLGRRAIWDRVSLDMHFSALPSEGDDITLEALLEKSGRA